MTDSPPPPPAETDFTPVPVRARHDGWSPDRQVSFIEALSQSGCVEDAARSVGMSVASAYQLRGRVDALPFRRAWEAAIEVGVSRLSDAAMARAIHGVSVPVFYKGEQIGERRFYDERLTMFLLRYRDMGHYGKWLDRGEIISEKPDGPAQLLNRLVNRLLDWLHGDRDPTPHMEAGEEEDEATESEDAGAGTDAVDGNAAYAPDWGAEDKAAPSAPPAWPAPPPPAAWPADAPSGEGPRCRPL